MPKIDHGCTMDRSAVLDRVVYQQDKVDRVVKLEHCQSINTHYPLVRFFLWGYKSSCPISI